jgi:Icc-related predicted phosphoesterase
MKSFITAIVIAVVMVGGGLLYVNHIQKISDEMVQLNEEVITLLEQDAFEEAEQKISRINECIDQKRTVLAATGNHEELDKIEIYTLELEQYTKGRAREDALARCHVLSLLLEHLPKNYRLKLENIL